MTAQAQECVFEGLLLSAPVAPHDGLAQLRLAQEAAQVRTGTTVPGDSLRRLGPGQAWLRAREEAGNECHGSVLLLGAECCPGPRGAGQDPGSRVLALGQHR